MSSIQDNSSEGRFTAPQDTKPPQECSKPRTDFWQRLAQMADCMDEADSEEV